MKRYIAPMISATIGAVLIAGFGLLYVFVFSSIPGARWISILLVVLTAAIIGALATVLMQRIKEIKEGEEDDLGEY